MKNILFLTLDHGDLVDSIFKDLAGHGFNATVFSARSIKHILEDESNDDIHFFHLSHLDQKAFSTSTFCYFAVEESKLDELKDLIRESTKNFTMIKGAMFSIKAPDFEGSI